MTKFQRRTILILAKAYPNPTPKSVESVCSAGIDSNGNFVRLYPVPYRTLTPDKQYKKFQWIKVDITKSYDHRSESYTPRIDTLELGEHIPSDNNWAQRLEIIKPYIDSTLEEIDTKQQSLCIIKPYRIENLLIKNIPSEWPAKWKSIFNQLGMGDQFPNLVKIPHKFSYKYFCSQNCKGHEQQILDWEIGALYLKMVKQYGKKKALEKVYQKYFLTICSPQRDQHLFLGTILRHPRDWNILGIFWPKKESQLDLLTP